MASTSTSTARMTSSWANRPRPRQQRLTAPEPAFGAAPAAKGLQPISPSRLPSTSSCVEQPRLKLPHSSAASIDRICAAKLTPALFKRYQLSGTPLLIEGCLRSPSSGQHDWSLGSFVAAVGPEQLTCRIHGGDGFATSPDRWHSRSHMRSSVVTSASVFSESIASGLAAANDCYVQHDISGTLAGKRLAPTFDSIGRASGLRIHPLYGPLVNMWWGPPGHTEPLHMDVTDGTLLQLHGQKRVVLFPPSCWRLLRPYPLDPAGVSWAFSRLSLQAALAAEPATLEPPLREALARRMEVIVHEGDTLFIPACAAHEISGLELPTCARQGDVIGGSRAPAPTTGSGGCRSNSRLRTGAPTQAGASNDQHHVLSVNRFWETDPSRVMPHLPEDAQRAFRADPSGMRGRSTREANGRPSG
mmetsp:Transcript_4014/g.13260  ORF Transcript_4014/g.13260 Transcript_4014/m.13260 type:complete len:416 (-) Transcript_4014:440-1687(-)